LWKKLKPGQLQYYNCWISLLLVPFNPRMKSIILCYYLI
jgi:hypothetical protein